MPDAKSLEELRLRANLYKILSVLYQPPLDDHDEYIRHLGTCITSLLPELDGAYDEMTAYFEQQDSLSALQVEHAKLFIGPFGTVVPPYSSLHIDEKPQIMGESTFEAYQYYLEAGIDMEAAFKEPPDHITAELEFMYYLICNYLNSNDEAFLDRQRAFVTSHLAQWVIRFAEKLEQHAASAYYRNLGIITRNFIKRELVCLGS